MYQFTILLNNCMSCIFHDNIINFHIINMYAYILYMLNNVSLTSARKHIKKALSTNYHANMS